jgi:hypothetical protein
MAITLDVGEPTNIHPKNKQAVGQRLSMWALGTVYGQDTPTSGPLLTKHEIKGDKVILSFSHTDGGLKAKDGTLKSFVIAGADKQWHDAVATIEGKNVIVTCAEVSEPVAVRYAWKDSPEASLFNGAGLPASQFRTDDWELQLTAERPVRKVVRKPRASVPPADKDKAKE